MQTGNGAVPARAGISVSCSPAFAFCLLNFALHASKVAREAIRRRLPLPVTVHTEAHVEIDIALCDGLLANVAVASGALDLRADVRCVVELHVRLLRVAVNALPGEIDALLAHLRDELDSWPIGRDRVVADHARPDARQTRDRTGRHALMAVLRAGDLFADVNDVRELDRLHRIGPAIHEVGERRGKGRTRGREDGVALSWQHRRGRGWRHVALVQLTADAAREREDGNANDSCDEGTAAHRPQFISLEEDAGRCCEES